MVDNGECGICGYGWTRDRVGVVATIMVMEVEVVRGRPNKD